MRDEWISSMDEKKYIVIVHRPYLENREGKVRLVADIETWEEKFQLWYEVGESFSKFFVTERSDAFVVALLPWLMMKAKKLNREIHLTCKMPMSGRLYHQITNYYIPVLCNNIPYYNYIYIDAEINEEKLPSAGAVGAGISGGVDSSYTVSKYRNEPQLTFRLTHLVYYNVGIYGGFESTAEKEMQIKMRQIAKEAELEYLQLDSNICIDLYSAAHAPIVPAVFMSTTLALQKLFTVYYFSSTHLASDFHFSKSDASYYDVFNINCLSTENTIFCSAGIDKSRMEKIDFIADNPFVQNSLFVCVNVNDKAQNCSLCAKCTRTMAGLEVLGKLDKFHRVFDVAHFRQNPGYHWGFMLIKGKHTLYKEVVDLYLKKHKRFPISVYLALIKKWMARGFSTVNKSSRKVENEIR